jgi:NitT/TauT family transport system substrate-binding protein
MPLMQSRRDFTVSLSAAGATSLIDGGLALADEGPPETTTIRLRRDPSICLAPAYIAEDLLRAEGFTDIQYVPVPSGPVAAQAQAIGRGEIDFALSDPATTVFRLDTGVPITVLAGVHIGCFELFAHETVRNVTDLKGKRVGIDVLGSGKQRYVAIMAAHVGLDPHKDIEWVEGSSRNPMGLFPMDLFTQRHVDAFLGFPPEPQELRARKIGRMILSTTTDKPWSQYMCCMLVGNREFVRRHPVATKRLLRAVLKATDICAADPERAAQRLVDAGFAKQYDYALQTLADIPYAKWREYSPEDTLRFFALRQHEVGMIVSNPRAILDEGTDWRFLNELKRELKA